MCNTHADDDHIRYVCGIHMFNTHVSTHMCVEDTYVYPYVCVHTQALDVMGEFVNDDTHDTRDTRDIYYAHDTHDTHDTPVTHM